MNTPLKCDIEGNQLVIRIGIGTIAFCCKKKNGGPVPNNYGICDKAAYAKDVSLALCKEDEVGATVLTDALEKAFEIACNSGSTGINYK